MVNDGFTTRDLLSCYDAAFTKRFGHPAPIVPGKDGKLAKALIARYPSVDLQRWLLAFFESQDDFIVQSTYSLGVFQACLGKLIAAEAKQSLAESPDEARARRARVEAETAARFERERALFRKEA